MGFVLGKDYEGQDCMIARALEILGERWTLLIVRDAFFGVRRFNDFRDRLDVPRAVLSDRLKGLVAHGVMTRSPDPERPGREIYELTEAGRALWPVIYSMRSWGLRYGAGGGSQRVFTHITCGQALDEAGGCGCPVPPGPEEIVTSLRPGAKQSRSDRVSVALSEAHRLLAPLALDPAVASPA